MQVQLAPVTIDRIAVREEEKHEELTITEAVDNEDWGAVVLRTNFAQDWAREAKEANPKQEATLPEEYNRHQVLRLCVLDYYFSPLFPLPCLVDCAPPPLSITCFTFALTVLHMRASVSADVHPLCTVHARISSPLPYVSLHLPCTLPNPLTCVVPRPLYALW